MTCNNVNNKKTLKRSSPQPPEIAENNIKKAKMSLTNDSPLKPPSHPHNQPAVVSKPKPINKQQKPQQQQQQNNKPSSVDKKPLPSLELE